MTAVVLWSTLVVVARALLVWARLFPARPLVIRADSDHAAVTI